MLSLVVNLLSKEYLYQINIDDCCFTCLEEVTHCVLVHELRAERKQITDD